MNLDKIDNKIIALLSENARASYSEIGRIVGLSRIAVKNRITELEESGVIDGYRAVVKPQNACGTMSFIMNVELKADCFECAKEVFANANEIVTILQTTGNSRLMMVCVASSVQEMKDYANKIYNEVDGIVYISVQAVLDVIKGSL